MVLSDIDRLEQSARKQLGATISTTVPVMPGELLALCELARQVLANDPDHNEQTAD